MQSPLIFFFYKKLITNSLNIYFFLNSTSLRVFCLIMNKFLIIFLYYLKKKGF